MHSIRRDERGILASGQRYPLRPGKLSCLIIIILFFERKKKIKQQKKKQKHCPRTRKQASLEAVFRAAANFVLTLNYEAATQIWIRK